MIIDYESFTGLLSVGINPDTGAPSITRDAELGKIESYISVYEQEYLIRILGEDMCKAFTDYLNSKKMALMINGIGCLLFYQKNTALLLAIYFSSI